MTARNKPLKIVLQTERLRLRHMRPDDAEFMLGLLNDPAWLRFIGDRGVRTLQAPDTARELRLFGMALGRVILATAPGAERNK